MIDIYCLDLFYWGYYLNHTCILLLFIYIKQTNTYKCFSYTYKYSTLSTKNNNILI